MHKKEFFVNFRVKAEKKYASRSIKCPTKRCSAAKFFGSTLFDNNAFAAGRVFVSRANRICLELDGRVLDYTIDSIVRMILIMKGLCRVFFCWPFIKIYIGQ